VRIDGHTLALALTTDCTPRYCAADPKMGGMQAVAEAWRNITATGATPLAITDNMNFGNPEKPLVMGQFAAAVQGISAACTALSFPVVSGNVSLYNETDGAAILPTPAIGGLGVIGDAARAVGLALRPALELLAVGRTDGWLGQSLWLREIVGREEGPPPPVDLDAERRNGDFVRSQIAAGQVVACHDASDGGLLVAVAEMALAGGVGVHLARLPAGTNEHAWWFGEDQARYVLAVADAAELMLAADDAGVPVVRLGSATGSRITLADGSYVELADLRAAHERFFPAWMAADTPI
jgi:phosphoribosylformylglycinamidine (FGAM) synthase-like enzyme